MVSSTVSLSRELPLSHVKSAKANGVKLSTAGPASGAARAFGRTSGGGPAGVAGACGPAVASVATTTVPGKTGRFGLSEFMARSGPCDCLTAALAVWFWVFCSSASSSSIRFFMASSSCAMAGISPGSAGTKSARNCSPAPSVCVKTCEKLRPALVATISYEPGFRLGT